MSTSTVSVVVPTKNGVATLPALFDALGSQRLSEDVEIVAVDSGSSDGTLDLLAERADRLVRIHPEAFDHGLTRNLGIKHATGQLVVLLVQDALPLSDDWLRTLTAPLQCDSTLAATFARQRPRPEATALTRSYLRSWVASSPAAWTARLPGGEEEFRRLSPAERVATCTFDNVASCVRRSVWETHPFKATPIGEDAEWARDVLLGGYGISFVPAAAVLHSHDRSVAYEFLRTRALHARLYDLFGLQTIPSIPALGRAVASSLLRHSRCEWRHPAEWPRAGALAIAWPLGQFLGARDAKAGVVRRRVPPGSV